MQKSVSKTMERICVVKDLFQLFLVPLETVNFSRSPASKHGTLFASISSVNSLKSKIRILRESAMKTRDGK